VIEGESEAELIADRAMVKVDSSRSRRDGKNPSPRDKSHLHGGQRVSSCLLLILGFFFFVSTAEAQNWPSFRGPNGSGIADNQDLPEHWNVQESTNVLWKIPIAGLSHSSPIVWGNRIFLTTAVAGEGAPELRTGDGSVVGYTSADDMGRQTWLIYGLDKRTGEILWQKAAYEGAPRVRRHYKSSHATATPATDGRHLVALMGSEGLFCFDTNGELLWKTDVGILDVGLWGGEGPESQWGPASSPVIYKNLVIVQNDRQRDSFLAAYHIESGKLAWKTSRNEKPAWSTPALYYGKRPELITNSGNFLRGYDPATGEEFWRLSNDDSEVIVPSPVVVGDSVIITGSYPTGAKPVYAIRLGGRGDISLAAGQTANQNVLWKSERGSPYTPTPMVYRNIVYVCVDNGILSAYDLETGNRLYRERIAVGAGFSASPVASDGKIYFFSEDGDVYIVKAGPEYELLAQNDMGEILMATPAISDGLLILRGRSHLYAVSFFN
jgi:outer membrane protein assembly factor BamB